MNKLNHMKIETYLALLQLNKTIPIEKWKADDFELYKNLAVDKIIVDYLTKKLKILSPTPITDMYREILNIPE